MSVTIREFKPTSALRPYVELFWQGDFNSNKVSLLSQRVVPNGYVELIIHLTDYRCELFQQTGFSPSPDYTFIGLFTKPFDVTFSTMVRVFGIRFKPEGIFSLFQVPAAEFKEDFVDAESLAGRNFKDFCDSIREKISTDEMISHSENFLLSHLSKNKINLYYLNRAAELIRQRKGLLTIEDLSGNAYISTRQLEREFKQKLGLSPKQYMRIARLNGANRMLKKNVQHNFPDLSYACGYSDQAHFIRDFKNFTGESPTAFLRKKNQFIVNPSI